MQNSTNQNPVPAWMVTALQVFDWCAAAFLFVLHLVELAVISVMTFIGGLTCLGFAALALGLCGLLGFLLSVALM